jgi:hypothetical protein
MSTPKQNPYDMPREDVEARYFKLKGRCDFINKWIPRWALGVAAVGVLAVGGMLLAGAAGVGIVATSIFAAAILPMGLSSIPRETYEMEMRGLSMANNFHIDVAESREEQKRDAFRKELGKEFDRIAEHGGTKEQISVKGPLKLKLRVPSFLQA